MPCVEHISKPKTTVQMKKIASLCLLLVLFGTIAFGQQTRSISGHISDEAGAPIGAATIYIKGTTSGTMTDVNGHFKLNVKNGAILIISSIGFKSKEIAADGQTEISIKLAFSSKSIEEVIVT